MLLCQLGVRDICCIDGKLLQSMEHVGTFKEVIAVLLIATHEKNEILLKIENLDQGHSTAAELTNILLDTLDNCNTGKYLIIGLMFDTASINTGIHKRVTVCLERAFDNNLLQLGCQYHALELLRGAAASLVYSTVRQNHQMRRLFKSFSMAGLVLINWTSKCTKQKVRKKRLNLKMSLLFANLRSLMMPPKNTIEKF